MSLSPNNSLPTEPIWVDSYAQLQELCQRWRQQAAVAVDTEFMRSQTFYPHAGLLQVGDGRGCYLIDPLAIDDLTPLAELFTDPAVTKVIHACSEDLEVFRHRLGVLPTPLFDTQVAAAFAGYGFSIGYAGLVKAVLGVEVPKGETRSDWMQRPLSQSQLHYAALDVAYLLVVYGKLLQSLKAEQRLDWVKADCVDLLVAAGNNDAVAEAYKKVKLAWKLYPDELSILQQLCLWREAQARERDVPRNRLMRETALWELARTKPTSVNQLLRIDGLPSRIAKNDGDTLIGLIERGRDADTLPARLPKPLPPEQGDLLKALKARTRQEAETLGLPPEVLVRKKDYEAIVRSGMAGGFQLPPRLQGWRRAVIGELLLGAARDFAV